MYWNKHLRPEYIFKGESICPSGLNAQLAGSASSMAMSLHQIWHIPEKVVCVIYHVSQLILFVHLAPIKGLLGSQNNSINIHTCLSWNKGRVPYHCVKETDMVV